MTEQPNEETYEDTASLDQLSEEQLAKLIEEGRKEDEDLAARTDDKGFLTEEGSA